MKLTLSNVKTIKKQTDNPLTKRVCNYVISRWSDYSDKKDIFTDVLYHGCQSGIFDDNDINYSIVKRERKIKVEMPVREIVFVNIVQKLSATFGNPKYIDRYYGYIWSINQKYISFNIIETGYQIEEMYVYIFKKLPLARRITYTDYTLLDTMITHTLEKHCFTCDNFLHYKLIGNEYLYFGHGINYECIVKLKRNCLTFSLSEKQLLSETTYRLIPIFYKKFKVNIRDLETIQQILSKCLSLLKNNET